VAQSTARDRPMATRSSQPGDVVQGSSPRSGAHLHQTPPNKLTVVRPGHLLQVKWQGVLDSPKAAYPLQC
jgi:hypothetical protein